MTDVSAAASALAAAFAAAAELVKSGDFLFSMDTNNNNNAMVNFGSTAATVTHSTKLIAEQLYATTETLSLPSTATSSLTLPPSTRTMTTTTMTMNDLKTDEANADDDDDEEQDDEPDAEQRLARSRERNREHARRTRLRKKAQLEALQRKVKGLEAEGRTLRQSIEECSIASILVGLSSGSGGGGAVANSASSGEGGDATSSSSSTSSSWSSVTGSACPAEKVALLVAGKRKRFISDDMMMTTTTLIERPSQTLALSIDGHTTLIGGGKTHINWKTGVYSDENGLQRKLTAEQLENLRRERNRMHAKMTRDRKKCFIRTIEKTIEELETENERLRSLLCTAKSATTPSSPVTPFSSPKLSATATAVPPSRLDELSASSSPSPAPSLIAEPIEANHTPDTSPAPAATTTSRVSHGFSLIG